MKKKSHDPTNRLKDSPDKTWDFILIKPPLQLEMEESYPPDKNKTT